MVRRPTTDELHEWFGELDRNIGVVCGQVSGGLVVIDCDDFVTYEALCYRYPELRFSKTALTGKGVHIYCHASEPVKTAPWKANGATHHIKAEGSMVVAPPSLHASGKYYRWANQQPMVELDLPRLRFALARIGAAPDAGEGPKREPGWAALALREGAREGSRDDTTYLLAAHFAHYGLRQDVIEEVLTLWAETRCEQPWGREDVNAKVRSAMRRNLNIPTGETLTTV